MINHLQAKPTFQNVAKLSTPVDPVTHERS